MPFVFTGANSVSLPESFWQRNTVQDVPDELQPVLDTALAAVSGNLRQLAEGDINLDAWHKEMERLLVAHHVQAYQTAGAGIGIEAIDAVAREQLQNILVTQLGFLGDFRLQIQDDDTFRQGWLARVQNYAGGIHSSWSRRGVKALPLPVMPTEGTQCGGRCRCSWRIVEVDLEDAIDEGDLEDDVDEDELEENYNCYWTLGGARRHCQTCVARSRRWRPLRIRGGRVVV